jgi:hypothetical protein
LYDGGSFVSQTARGHLEEDQALVALELAHGGHYRREMDVETATAAEPTYTATWHPRNGPAQVLIRGSSGQAYWACVRHYQANYSA